MKIARQREVTQNNVYQMIKKCIFSACISWMQYSMHNTSISDSATLPIEHQAEEVEFRFPNTFDVSLPHLEAILSWRDCSFEAN